MGSNLSERTSEGGLRVEKGISQQECRSRSYAFGCLGSEAISIANAAKKIEPLRRRREARTFSRTSRRPTRFYLDLRPVGSVSPNQRYAFTISRAESIDS